MSLTLEQARKIPREKLLTLVNGMKAILKKDKTMQDVFKEFGVDINEIDNYPVIFKDLPVSARTDHSIIYLNYKLLMSGKVEEVLNYLIHETTHILQQTCSTKALRSSGDDNYINNKNEVEAFQNQVEFMANNSGEDKANKYVDHLVDYHNLNDSEKKNKKKELMKKVDE